MAKNTKATDTNAQQLPETDTFLQELESKTNEEVHRRRYRRSHQGLQSEIFQDKVAAVRMGLKVRQITAQERAEATFADRIAQATTVVSQYHTNPDVFAVLTQARNVRAGRTPDDNGSKVDAEATDAVESALDAQAPISADTE